MDITKFSEFLVEGSSKGTQFNTELASLLACVDSKVSDFSYENILNVFYNNSNRFASFDNMMVQIELHLSAHFDEKQFSSFYKSSVELMKNLPGLSGITLDWVSEDVSKGSERDPSDILFVGSDYAGISVKASSSTTLANLTTKALGIDNKGDLFQFFNKDLYNEWKETIILQLLSVAKKSPDKVIIPNPTRPYSIKYNSKAKTYTLGHETKKTFKGKDIKPEDVIGTNISSNTKWKTVFGIYFVQNKDNRIIRKLTKELYNSVAAQIFDKITETMTKDTAINSMMGIITKPYYYLNNKDLYRLPSRHELENKLEFKTTYSEVTDSSKNITGLKFKCEGNIKGIKEKGSFEIQIRYADGVFASSPTVRVQQTKNLQYLGWKHLS